MGNSDLIDLFDFIEQHRSLSMESRKPGRLPFISDWNGDNPLSKEYMGHASNPASGQGPLDQYHYLKDQDDLVDSVRALHLRLDDLELPRESILLSAGSTPLLTIITTWLFQQQSSIYYLPPLYFTMAYVMKVLGMNPRPISGRQAYESDFMPNLPRRQCTLLLTDPVWYVGRRIPEPFIDRLAEWQRETDSLVVTDGSFQYMRWGDDRSEATARLDPDRSIRIVCPSKSLCLHGLRFAYATVPERFHAELSRLYGSMIGSASAQGVHAAARMLDVLVSNTGNRALTKLLESRFQTLERGGAFEDYIKPECGYFVFGKPRVPPNSYLAMSGEYFQQPRYPGFARVNLLSQDAIAVLLGDKSQID